MTMQNEDRALQMLRAALASQTEVRSILRLEQIAIKGMHYPDALTIVEIKDLCSSVIRHLTWQERKR